MSAAEMQMLRPFLRPGHGTLLARPQRVPVELRFPIPIAIVVTSFEPGGTERQMTELIRRLDPQQFRVHVGCFRKTGAWLPKVEAVAAEVVQFRLRSFKSPASMATLGDFAGWLRARDIAVVQACDLYANVFALPGAALAQVPVRIGSRRELAPPDKTRAHLAAQRFAYRAAHRVVANSSAGAERLRAEGVPDAKVLVISNGIDLSQFPAPLARERRRIVATVANLRPEKGHDVLLRAAALMRGRIPDAQFRIIGDGPLRASLQQLAHELGVQDMVEFLGHREDVGALLQTSDLYAFPSRTEAFPNGLIEGMAAGLPVVASGVGGMLELVDDRRNGLLVPAGDERALADALVELMEHARLADDIAAAARQTIEARYSFERMVAAFSDLYISELTARGRIGALLAS
jgi:glycosyltransferase involved in cell wall biosynthesis